MYYGILQVAPVAASAVPSFRNQLLRASTLTAAASAVASQDTISRLPLNSLGRSAQYFVARANLAVLYFND